MARSKTRLSREQEELLGALQANRAYIESTEERILTLVRQAKAARIPVEAIIKASGFSRSTFYRRIGT